MLRRQANRPGNRQRRSNLRLRRSRIAATDKTDRGVSSFRTCAVPQAAMRIRERVRAKRTLRRSLAGRSVMRLAQTMSSVHGHMPETVTTPYRCIDRFRHDSGVPDPAVAVDSRPSDAARRAGCDARSGGRRMGGRVALRRLARRSGLHRAGVHESRLSEPRSLPARCQINQRVSALAEAVAPVDVPSRSFAASPRRDSVAA